MTNMTGKASDMIEIAHNLIERRKDDSINGKMAPLLFNDEAAIFITNRIYDIDPFLEIKLTVHPDPSPETGSEHL